MVPDDGVLVVKSGDRDSHDPGEDVHLIFRPETGRWLVVQSGDESAPLGATATYPDDIFSLAKAGEIVLQHPVWEPVLSRMQLQARLQVCEAEAADRVRRLASSTGRMLGKELIILYGPPGAGKTFHGRNEDSEINYDASVRLVQEEVVEECVRDLFAQIAAARQGGLLDHQEKEAFLIETLRLSQIFQAHSKEVLWEGEDSVLSEALEQGLRIVAETDGAALTGPRLWIEDAHEQGYSVTAYYVRAQAGDRQRRVENRFMQELSTRKMLGGRRFDAYVDRCASKAETNWPHLMRLVDHAYEVGEPPHVIGGGSYISGD